MNKKRVGIIGVGHQSQNDHIPGILKSKSAELVSLCDINEEIIKKYEKDLKIKTYVDYEKMLINEKLDFVIIAVPHHKYKPIVTKAIENGIHILKEKPFALNIDEAIELKRKCDEHNVHMMITMQRRFNPIFYSYFQLINQIGDIFSIDIKYNLYVKEPHIGWRGDIKQSGGGCILDMGYHMVDMIIWYFGIPDYIHAETSAHAINDDLYDAEDSAQILFSYGNSVKNKINGSLTLSRSKPPKTEKINVYGSEGYIEVQRGSIRRFDLEGNLIESLSREVSWPSASTTQIDYFCKVIDGVLENHSSPEIHLSHVAFVEACYKSCLEKRHISPKSFLKINVRCK